MSAVEHVAGEIDQQGVQRCRRCNFVLCDAAEYGDMVTSDGTALRPLYWTVDGAIVFDGPLKCQRDYYRGPASQCEGRAVTYQNHQEVPTMAEKKITFGELKAALDTFTPEQLRQYVMWGGEDRGGFVGEVHVFEDDQVNPSGDGWEDAADYRKQLLEDGETPDEADSIVAAETVLHKGSPVLFVDVPVERFRAGDVVRHRPSGETWVLAYAAAERNEVSACGWPESIAKADDCVLVEAATDEKHEEMLRRHA